MKNFDIYKNMDAINVDLLTEAAGATTWPKRSRYTVNCDGVEIKIQAFFAKIDGKFPKGGVDEYTLAKFNSQHMYMGELYRENGDYPDDDPEITFNQAYYDNPLSKKQMQKRFAFLTAIANLINNQETMEAIAQAATKKKNGTLHVGKEFKIASMGIALPCDAGFALFAKNKDDNTISIYFDLRVSGHGHDCSNLANDFISTPHEGLKLSELIAKSLPTNH